MEEIFELIRSSRLLIRCYYVSETEHVIRWLVERGMVYSGWDIQRGNYPMRIGANPHTYRVDGWGTDASVLSYFRDDHCPEPDIIEYKEWVTIIESMPEEYAENIDDIPDELI